MAEQTYPPAGDPNRFDAIVERGTALRRRRRGTAIGAMGSFVVVIGLAAVLIVGRPGPASSSVVADGPGVGSADTTSSTTTAPSTEMSVEVTDDGDRIVVTVDDPMQPVSEYSRQCVHASLFPVENPAALDPVAEGSICDLYPGVTEQTDSNELLLVPTTSVVIGCAAVGHGSLPEPIRTAPRSSEVQLSTGDVAPGTYRLVVTASSGIGDGCLPDPQPNERRTTAASTIVVD